MTTITLSPQPIIPPQLHHYDGTYTHNGAINFGNLAAIDTGGSIEFTIYDTSQGIPAPTDAYGNAYVMFRLDAPSLDASSIPSTDGIIGFDLSDAGDIASGVAFDSDNHLWFYAQAPSIISGLEFGPSSLASQLEAESIVGGFQPSSDVETAHLLIIPSISSATAFSEDVTVDYAVQQDTDSIPSALTFGPANIAQVIYGLGFSSESLGINNIGFPSLGFHATNLDPLIFIYDPAFYNALYAMETYCYAQTNGVSTYGSGFTTLSTAIVNYIQKDRTSFMRNFINSLFSYCVMNTMYGSDGSLLGSSAYNQIWGMNGYNQIIKAAADTYYADSTGDKLTSDASTINSVVSNNTDDTKAQTFITKYNDVVSNQVMVQMFSINVPAPTIWTKTNMNYKIFTGLGYLHVYQCFVTGLTMPDIGP